MEKTIDEILYCLSRSIDNCLSCTYGKRHGYTKECYRDTLNNTKEIIKEYQNIQKIKDCGNLCDMDQVVASLIFSDFLKDNVTCGDIAKILSKATIIKGNELSEFSSGEWIDISPISWKCPKCGYEVMKHNNTPYCPNCGSKLNAGKQQEEDR